MNTRTPYTGQHKANRREKKCRSGTISKTKIEESFRFKTKIEKPSRPRSGSKEVPL